MNARLLTTATLVSVFAGMLPARAADTNLLNLIMPDATVLAGVNVDQARTSPFGQYVLSQFQSQTNSELQKLTALTGFDPTQDVHELLAATNGGAGNKSGLVAARGSFDVGRILALAATQPNAKTETYGGVTIIEDEKQQGGLAFLNSTYVVAGDLASVKGAIDRQKKAQPLPAAVITQVNQWSLTQDAWAITTVPPSSLQPAAGAPPIPGVGPSGKGNAFQAIQSAAGGVKFGTNVVVTGQAVADNAQDATNIGDMFKLLASMAQLQSQGDPNVMALAKSLTVTTSGSTLNVTVSLPQEMLQNIVKPKPAMHRAPMVKK